MIDLPSLPPIRILRAFEKAGFWILREGKHTVMTNGKAAITIPHLHPVNRWTLEGIVKAAGMTAAEFRNLI
jgi:hypothetical protein